MHIGMERTFTGGGLTGPGFYMVVMLRASGALEPAFRQCVFILGGWCTYIHTAHGSSYADDNKSAFAYSSHSCLKT